MSLPRLWAFLAVALPIVAAVIAPLQTVDLTYHLRAGADILESGAIPATDTWTFTAAGLPWVDQQWGAQVFLAGVFEVGGWTGLVLLRAALVGLVFGSLYLVARQRGLTARSAAWLTLVAFIVSAAALGLRPQLLGMALFALVLLLVADRRRHRRRLWIVPLLVLVWANLHGSFFLGPVLLGLAWLEDVHDRASVPHQTMAVAALSALAACVTPFGPAVWSYAVGLAINPDVTGRITEWQRTSPFEVSGILFYVSAAGVVALLARRRRATPWPTFLWLGLFFIIGAYAVRGIAWWSLGAFLPVAGMLAEGRLEGSARQPQLGSPAMRRVNVVLVAAIVLAGIAAMPAWRANDAGLNAPQGLLASAPAGITGSLREIARPGDRLFNPQIWGSWFEFALPELPVAIDSRIELFPTDVWDAYDLVRSGQPGWEAQLIEWGVTIAVVEASDSGFLQRLQGLGWRSIRDDVDGSILVAPDR